MMGNKTHSAGWVLASDEGGRAVSRLLVDFQAGLRPRGGVSPLRVRVIDLSIHGFRVESDMDLRVGSDVWLRLPGLEVCHAQVAWTDGYVIGCAFKRPLHPAVLEMVAGSVLCGDDGPSAG
ncbi:PilZ domain-containing protein [Sphingosinicella sp. LHD-64]|uniref:PilZ domain-containing protein n=1 Tax=Sphingosinicella sp. LHD-64 TaxID=3072139 RepID=UPI0035BEA469